MRHARGVELLGGIGEVPLSDLTGDFTDDLTGDPHGPTGDIT
ncbi:MAG: hypothetical protein RQ731_09320 [Anaerosomatales bacterium]|nr:hypothetical protein [Anaerosomatales bacterium]MDT8434937.1 hypothetical protein [Anaerosomatales bacterium]